MSVTFDPDGGAGLGRWSCGCYIDSGAYVTGPGPDDWESGPFTSYCERHSDESPPETDEVSTSNHKRRDAHGR